MPTCAPSWVPPLPPPPPSSAPPPCPTAAAAGAAAVAQDEQPSGELAQEVAGDGARELLEAVGRRVSAMLAAATHASEQRVGAEVGRLEAGLTALSAKVSKLEALLAVHDPGARRGPEDALDKVLAEVELRWEQEINAIKRELHQAILAHNHNADLMADHKAAIDQICAEIDERGPPAQQESDLHLREHLDRLCTTLESDQVDQDVDALLRREETLVQQLGSLALSPGLAVGIAPPAPRVAATVAAAAALAAAARPPASPFGYPGMLL